MTRVRTDENGKPLPTALQEGAPIEIIDDEPTVRTPVPSPDELDAHLAQVAAAGQGLWPTTRRKGPL